ncbi:MAG: 2'-5' RNA ligase family protein [Promethearchaeota archaeon]
MSKVYTSAVVIIPPQEKWGPLQDIRENYDRNITRWMPHITLLYPFRPQTEYNDIENEFSNVCKLIKPFEISLKNFNFFPSGRQTYTLWLDPRPNDSIINLQLEILKIVPDCSDVNKFKSGFQPHLSVGQIKGKNNLLKVMKDLQVEWQEIKFILKNIFFIARDNNKMSSFNIVKQVQFNEE